MTFQKTTPLPSPVLLLVDDEPNVLSALTRLFRGDGYRILTANSGRDALALLADEQVDAIISDMRMPEMSGSEFLQHAAGLAPDIPRLLLSGQRDLDLAIVAVNEGQISHYIEKPWDPEKLRSCVRQVLEKSNAALERKQLLDRIKVQNEQLSKLNKELLLKTREAETRNQLKSRFLATMSHEIRTPVTGILGVLELLKEESLNAGQRDLVCTGLNSSLHLKQVVDDLLDLSKLDVDQMELESLPYMPSDVIESVADLFRSEIQKNGLTLHLHDIECLSGTHCGDQKRVKQILMNLVSNAIKFTEKGEITITACVNENETFSICVIDTGIGIPDELKPGLYREFGMLHSSHARLYGGTGLGLSISQKFATLMHGTIEMEDNPVGGSCFKLTLPMRQADCQDAAKSSLDSACTLQDRKILLVDDNTTNLKVIGSMLNNMGCQVTNATNGLEAWQLIKGTSAVPESRFDLVLMDIAMPVMDGIECCRLIRESGGIYKNIPVIAMTAYAQESERRTFRVAGMNDILLKPMTGQDLQSMLENVLASSSTGIECSSVSASGGQLLNLTVLQQLAQDTSIEILPELIGAFIEDTRLRSEQISKSEQEGNYTAILHEIHTLGSSAGMFGAEKLYHMCIELERSAKLDQDHLTSSSLSSFQKCLQDSLNAIDHWLKNSSHGV